MNISVALCSGKGGTGKTTLTANLAVELSRLDYDVLAIDGDIRTPNLSILLGVEVEGPTVDELLRGEVLYVSKAVYEGPEGVKVLPGSVDQEKEGVPEGDIDTLGRIIRNIKNEVDITLIDTPPGMGKVNLVSLHSCDGVVMVTTPDISSLSDGLKIKTAARRGEVPLAGNVISKVLDPPTLTTEQMERALELETIAEIPDSREVRRITDVGRLFVQDAPDSMASRAVRKLAADLVGDEVSETVDSGRREGEHLLDEAGRRGILGDLDEDSG